MYTDHWCGQLAALEKEVKERSKKESAKEEQEAEVPMINPAGFGNQLLLTQGNGYGICYYNVCILTTFLFHV